MTVETVKEAAAAFPYFTEIDGVVGAVLVRAGEVVQPGQALVQIRAQETSV